MRWTACLLLALGWLAACPTQALAGRDVEAELAQIEQERAKLKQVRMHLEKRLGQLGGELRRLDEAVVRAGAENREVKAALARADSELARLTQRQQVLTGQISRMQHVMAAEAAAAFRRAGASTHWLAALQQGGIADLPHRRYMLARLLAVQEKHRQQYVESIAELRRLQIQLVDKREELATLREKKQKAKRLLAQQQLAKRDMWRRLRRDADLQRQRDQQLAAQADALRRLLDDLQASLLLKEEGAAWASVRERKGRLDWPLQGKIVAHFGKRPAVGRARLDGVQLAPLTAGRQVKAIAAGQVRYADWFGGYGLMLILDHGDGMMSVYAHNDILYKGLGEWVEEGEALAEAGSTGWVQDVRLYFELRDGGRPVNPSQWCRR